MSPKGHQAGGPWDEATKQGEDRGMRTPSRGNMGIKSLSRGWGHGDDDKANKKLHSNINDEKS